MPLKGLSQNARYWCTIGVSAFISGVGIIIGACGNPIDGQRGGAIAVAFSFLILFIRKNYGVRVYKALTVDFPKLEAQIQNLKKQPPLAPGDATLELLDRKVTALVSRLNIEADGQQKQNAALAWASCIGTITWGFGDFPAQWLKDWCFCNSVTHLVKSLVSALHLH